MFSCLIVVLILNESGLGLFLRTIHFDDAVRADHRAAGAADAAVLVHHLEVVVPFRIYVFGKTDALVGASRDADTAALALLRVND